MTDDPELDVSSIADCVISVPEGQYYVPKTMIGRAGQACWNNIGKHLTPLQEAERVVRRLRDTDMELVRRVAKEIKESPVLVDLVWCRVIDAILAQIPDEETALAEFVKALKP